MIRKLLEQIQAIRMQAREINADGLDMVERLSEIEAAFDEVAATFELFADQLQGMVR